jgi:hypothetical protein
MHPCTTTSDRQRQRQRQPIQIVPLCAVPSIISLPVAAGDSVALSVGVPCLVEEGVLATVSLVMHHYGGGTDVQMCKFNDANPR